MENIAGRLIKYVVIGSMALFLTAPVFSVSADDLVIDKNGSILLITSSNNVLAASTDQKKEESKPKQTVTLVPPKTESKVEMHTTANNKIEAKITVPASRPSAPSAPSASSSIPAPATNPTPAPTVITKTVDTVVAQGQDNQKIYTIGAGPENKLTISQNNTQTTTTLPSLSIESASHTISVTTKVGLMPLNVLPDPAFSAAIQNRLISAPTPGTMQPKITLIQDQLGQPVYDIQGEKKVNIANIFQFTSPVEVKVNAGSGQTNVNEPLYIRLSTMFGL